MAKHTYDTVYYWFGGREVGQWHETLVSPDVIEETMQSLAKMGYVAHRGRRSIGAPEGPPSARDFKALGL